MSKLIFNENINVMASDEFIASHCEVQVDDGGYFVHIITDDYEGHAMMTLPVAVEVHRALGEAIRVAQEHRKSVATAPQ